MTTKAHRQLQEIRDTRWWRFVMDDKNFYVCYRFCLALEKLLPPEMSQIKPVAISDDATADDWKDTFVIEKTPRGVYERYVIPVYDEPLYAYERIEAIRELVRQYCRYLDSTQLDRIEWYGSDRERWQPYV